MSVGKRLQRWWDELLGRPPWYRDTDVTRTRPWLADAADKPDNSGLSLTEDSKAVSPKPRRSAGSDPYSNDAGFQKPHGWERVDHD